jgi:hypothetical protein
MNRLDAVLGYLVEVRDEVNGTSRTIKVPMSQDQFFWGMCENETFGGGDDDPEPEQVNVVLHCGEDRAVLRFWSPLPAAEASTAVAAAVADWEAGR